MYRSRKLFGVAIAIILGNRGDSMKIMVAGFIFAVMQVLPGALAQEPKLTLQLTLSPDHVTVTPDSNFNLFVKWVNRSHKPLSCMPIFSAGKIDENFVYDIRTIDGNHVPRVPGTEQRDYTVTSECQMAPDGGSTETPVGCVMCAFEMRRPGVYTVQISRPDPDRPKQMLGRSNIVTVTVKAPK